MSHTEGGVGCCPQSSRQEMRFGLWGQVRRRWGLKGKKIIQRMQNLFHWSYLVLAVEVMRGELHWGWS